ncbi:SMI1/KNR4 family protein [Nonomuraea lactucae]|uniref:SMI1/KNR4 family protein n=1 Tax=Nonomuraea lactucae TaxID=2249762 RepID=UPI0013B463FE|nr:SMI1/KNR4 family protein [Nonomuraea lactucae]
MAQWPPVPILGIPTAEDLERYAAKPSGFGRPAPRTNFDGVQTRAPLDEAARRRLTRWGIAGAALCLLTVGTHALESAVFSNTSGGAALSVGLGLYPHVGFGLYPEAYQDEIPAPDDGHVPEPSPEEPTQEPVPATQSGPDADCRPQSHNPRVRTLDAKVTRAVNRQWQRIEAWLRTHAPRSHRTLGKPATAVSIAAAEARMGLRFPDDLRASLLRHDGAAFGFLGNQGSSVRDIQDTWRRLCELDGDAESSDPRTEWWDGRMLPIGTNGMGDHLVIDSVKRDVGNTDHEGNMSFTPGGVRIRSYYALLKVTADAMENGGSIGYWTPRAVAGVLDWEVR